MKLHCWLLTNHQAALLLKQRFWPAHGPEVNNSSQIVSRNGPRALSTSHYTMTKTCSGLPSAPLAIVADALSGDACTVSWLEANLPVDCDFSPLSFARIGRAPARMVLPRPLSGDVNSRNPLTAHDGDNSEDDPHLRDWFSAAADFDDHGVEHDDPVSDEDPD